VLLPKNPEGDAKPSFLFPLLAGERPGSLFFKLILGNLKASPKLTGDFSSESFFSS
jgi:hypothetical protein